MEISHITELCFCRKEGGEAGGGSESKKLHITSSQQRELWTLVSLQPTAAQRLTTRVCTAVCRNVAKNMQDYVTISFIVKTNKNKQKYIKEHKLSKIHTQYKATPPTGSGEMEQSYLIALSAGTAGHSVDMDNLNKDPCLLLQPEPRLEQKAGSDEE